MITSNELYTLPKTWVWTRLSDVAEIVTGNTPPKNDPSNYGDYLPFVKPPELNDCAITEAQDNLSQKGSLLARILPLYSVLVSCIGNLGKSGINKVPVAFNQQINAIILHNEVIPLFGFYFVQTIMVKQCLLQLASATTVAIVNKSKFSTLPFPLSPLAEQHRIVAKIEELFTKLDAGVEALKKVKVLLKRYRQSVLKSAFEGKLTAEWREAHKQQLEPASVLLERIKEERKKTLGKKYKELPQLDTSQLPELPEGWVWTTWEHIGFSQNGRSFPSRQYQSKGVKLLRPGNLNQNGQVIWTDANSRYLPEHWAGEFPAFVVEGEELVMNLTAQSLKDEFLGRVCLTNANDRCLLNQRIARLTPVLVDKKFLLYLFKTLLFRRFVDGLNTGSLIQHMFTSQLANFSLPLPSRIEQDYIVQEVERHFSVADIIEKVVVQTLTQAGRLRQSTLKTAFEGRLVPQNPTDEPAEKLLERIKEEKAKKELENKNKKTKKKLKKLELTCHG